jgi:hypothetical protein
MESIIHFICRLDDGFDSELAGRAHDLQGHKYCWCDRDAVMQYNAVIFTDIFPNNNFVIRHINLQLFVQFF